jgi:hypothetical protein
VGFLIAAIRIAGARQADLDASAVQPKVFTREGVTLLTVRPPKTLTVGLTCAVSLLPLTRTGEADDHPLGLAPLGFGMALRALARDELLARAPILPLVASLAAQL